MAVVSSGSPFTARRKLGNELRMLRDRAGLTASEVAGYIGCHNSKVSRIERAQRVCSRKDFTAMMELFEVDGEKYAELSELAKRAMQRIPPWWDAYADVISANYAEFLAYEAEATRCCEYQPLVIPGLLQTSAYAHAVNNVSFTALGPDQVESLVEVRMRRQERLSEDAPLALEAVVTEAALRLNVGGTATMREQLRHLRELAGQDNVTVRIIPFSAGENAASAGAFTLFGVGNDADIDVAFTESADFTMSYRDEPLTLRHLNRRFRRLSAAALAEDDGFELIERIEGELG